MRGGKRRGSGRKKGDEKEWKDYKKDAKKRKLEEAAKISGKLDMFVMKKVASDDRGISSVLNRSYIQDNEGYEIDDTSSQQDPIIPNPLPFFENGCKIKGIVL